MFKTENCLVNASIPHCKTLTSPEKQGENDVIVMQEVNMGFGVADIVVIDFNMESHINRENNLFLNKNDALIYKLVEQHGIVTHSSIRERTKLNKRIIKESIAKLELAGYIYSDNEEIRFIKHYQSAINNSVAIEAKLRDWRRALNQAYRYKWFATKSYVLLDKAKAGPAKKNIFEFVKLGVGLLTIELGGEIRIIYDPGLSKPFDKRMAMLLSERVSAHFNAN